MHSTITLGALIDLAMERVSRPLRIRIKRSRLRNSVRDVKLSADRIQAYRQSIADEESHIKKCHTAQAVIKSDLRALGAPIADE